MTTKTEQKPAPRAPDPELERLRRFLADVRGALSMDPRSPSGGSPEACILNVKHAIIRYDGAAPPAEPKPIDPSILSLRGAP